MSTNNKKTRPAVTHIASDTLRNKAASKTAKSLAGSAMAQSQPNHQTGAKMEDLASRVLQSDKYNGDTKSLAGAVLAQSNKKR